MLYLALECDVNVHLLSYRVVVGILDSFHFEVSDVSSTSSLEEKKDLKMTDKDSDSLPDEVAEERVEEDMEEGGGEKEGECSVSPLQLQQKIHDAIVFSILPSLQAILTKASVEPLYSSSHSYGRLVRCPD